ncbi:Serine/threonine-protein kinase svkA [Smittium culicis]|uniref:non-specific serine/threonine protein kinase n=1 Tax=Smittium culicis TaxID=133412 RepID=A0A1R1X1E8_9FUNG|nr:Serine/threonine-protein kinase svkA [Smittium culicis]OMJ16796.1 Serine/threonine-protein kinase svkA [Smittium culicis]
MALESSNAILFANNVKISKIPPKTNERYVKQKLVGRGAYGLVYKGLDTFTNNTVAIKIMNLDKNDENISDIQREISLLSQLNSPFITRYFSSFVNNKNLWILLEYAEGGSIYKLMKAGPLQEKYTGVVLYSVLRALDYLNTYGIMHRDIKAANILVTDKGNVQLCDFGVARQSVLFENSNKTHSFVGTPYWMAPEVISKDREYDHKADIWSLGITCFEIVTGSPPLVQHDPKNALALILKNGPPRLTSKHASHELQEFVVSCLEPEPSLRASAKDLLNSNRFIKSARSNIKNVNMTDLIERYNAWEKQNLEALEKEFDSIIDDIEEEEHSPQEWIFDHLTSLNADDSEETKVNIERFNSSIKSPQNIPASLNTISSKNSFNAPPTSSPNDNFAYNFNPNANFTDNFNPNKRQPVELRHTTSKFFSNFFTAPEKNDLQPNSPFSHSENDLSQVKSPISDGISSIEFSDINRPYRSTSAESLSESFENIIRLQRDTISASYSGPDHKDYQAKNNPWKLKEVAAGFKKHFLRKKDFDLLKAYQKQKNKEFVKTYKKSNSSSNLETVFESKAGVIFNFGQNVLNTKNKSQSPPNSENKSFFKTFNPKSKLRKKYNLPKIQTDHSKTATSADNWTSTPTQSMPVLSGYINYPFPKNKKPDKLSRYASEGVSLFNSRSRDNFSSSALGINRSHEGLNKYSQKSFYDQDAPKSIQTENQSSFYFNSPKNKKDTPPMKMGYFKPNQNKDYPINSNGIDSSIPTTPSDINRNAQFNNKLFNNDHYTSNKIASIKPYNRDSTHSPQVPKHLNISTISSSSNMFVPISPLEQNISFSNSRNNLSAYYSNSNTSRYSYLSNINHPQPSKNYRSPLIPPTSLFDPKSSYYNTKSETISNIPYNASSFGRYSMSTKLRSSRKSLTNLNFCKHFPNEFGSSKPVSSVDKFICDLCNPKQTYNHSTHEMNSQESIVEPNLDKIAKNFIKPEKLDSTIPNTNKLNSDDIIKIKSKILEYNLSNSNRLESDDINNIKTKILAVVDSLNLVLDRIEKDFPKNQLIE